MEKKTFTLKTYGAKLYKWSPTPNQKKNVSFNINKNNLTYFCTANVGSQGEDFTETYVYNLVVINGQEHRYAYVECGYVE